MVELEKHHIANLINNFNKELKKLDSLELGIIELKNKITEINNSIQQFRYK